ncbi:MAG: peptidase M16, partial [Spirochaetia bacterium]|nr:peptidase M16 [Spirochaetia bacterium]
PNGLGALNRSLRGWLFELSPCATIETTKVLETLQLRLEENPHYFEQWIERNLLNNYHRCLVTVKPDPEHQKRQLDAIAKYAQSITDELGKKGLKALEEQNQRFMEFEKQGDDPQALATIPRLHLADLPKQIRLNTHEHILCGGQDVYVRSLFCNQIVYADFAIRLDDLQERELLLIPFYTRLVQMTGLRDMSYPQVANKLKHLTGDFNLFVELGTSAEDTPVTMMLCRTKMLREDFEESMQFIADLLLQAKVDDLKQIKLVLNNYRTDFADSVTYAAHSFASLAASSVFSPIQYEGEQLSGLHQWFFLESLDESDLSSLATELQMLQKKLANRSRLVCHLTCDEDQCTS